MFAPITTWQEVAAGGSAKQFPANNTEMADLVSELSLGLGSASHIWLFDEPSGTPTDEIASLGLSPTGTLTYQDVPTAFSGEFGVGITVNTNDRLQGGTGDLNPGTASALYWFVVEFGAKPAALVTVFEKFASGAGMSLNMDSDGSLDWKYDATAAQTISAASDHSSSTQLIVCARDVTNSRLQIFTCLDTVDNALTATGDADNSGPFRIGRFSSAGMEPAIYFAHFEGSAAEGFNATKYASLKTKLGL